MSDKEIRKDETQQPKETKQASRKARDSENKREEIRPEEDYSYYEEGSALTIPKHVIQRFKEDDLALRWIRVKNAEGGDDVKNIAKQLREYKGRFVTTKELDSEDFFCEANRVRLNKKVDVDSVVCLNEMALICYPIQYQATRREHFENKSRMVNSKLENQFKHDKNIVDIGTTREVQNHRVKSKGSF